MSEKDREAFEAWVRNKNFDLTYNMEDDCFVGGYVSTHTHFCFEGFKAAHQAATAVKDAEIAHLTNELAEQSRIIGAGGERELALMAKVERLQRLVDAAAQELHGLGYEYTASKLRAAAQQEG